MNNAKTPEPQAVIAEPLPVVQWEQYNGEGWGELVRLSDAQAIIDRLTRERDAAFAMSHCECSSEEACANLERLSRERDEARKRVGQLEAARIGYASEFPADAEGLPDVGSIHANIRTLKAAQVAPLVDVEKVMALADEYAWCMVGEERGALEDSAAAREALRAALASQANPAPLADDSRDAARYRWLRMQDWFSGPLCVLRDPKTVLARGTALGADCPSRERLDEAIDAALAASTDGLARDGIVNSEPARGQS